MSITPVWMWRFLCGSCKLGKALYQLIYHPFPCSDGSPRPPRGYVSMRGFKGRGRPCVSPSSDPVCWEDPNLPSMARRRSPTDSSLPFPLVKENPWRTWRQLLAKGATCSAKPDVSKAAPRSCG